jgi:hypothetical protein
VSQLRNLFRFHIVRATTVDSALTVSNAVRAGCPFRGSSGESSSRSTGRHRPKNLPSRSCATLQCLCQQLSGVVYLVHHTLLRPRSLRSLVLGDVLSCRARASSRMPLPSTPRFSLSHRVLPGTTSSPGADRVTALFPALSLSWGFIPYSEHQPKGSGSLEAPMPRHRASSEFEPLLTPSSPSSLPTISGQVARGIHPSGPCSSRRVKSTFRSSRTLLTFPIPTVAR